MRRQYKLMIAWILAFILGSGLYLFNEYLDAKESILRDVKRELGQAAQAVKYILPDGFHEKVPREVSKEEDDRNIRIETAYARERNIRFLYSFAMVGTNVIFTSSSINTNETFENPEVRYGFIFREASGKVKQAFGKTGFSFEEAEDRWGKFFAVYYTREEGSRKWLSGAEYRKDLFDDRLESAVFNALKKLGMVLMFFCVPYIIALFGFKRDTLLLKEDLKLLQDRYSKELRRGKH